VLLDNVSKNITFELYFSSLVSLQLEQLKKENEKWKSNESQVPYLVEQINTERDNLVEVNLIKLTQD
jgi:hypothetical protein